MKLRVINMKLQERLFYKRFFRYEAAFEDDKSFSLMIQQV